MWNLKACVVCLNTDSKLYNMDNFGLRNDYNIISSLNSYRGNGLSCFLCVECTARIKSFMNFRSKCQRTNFVLQELLNKNNDITDGDINALDRQTLDIMPSLSYSKMGTSYYIKIQFQLSKMNRNIAVQANVAPTLFISTIEQFDSKTMSQVNRLHCTQDVTKMEFGVLKQENLENISFHDSDEFNETECDKKETSCEIEPPVITDNYESKHDTSPESHIVQIRGSSVEEYAEVFPLTEREQRAIADIYPMFSQGKHKCNVCSIGYHKETHLKIHMNMHEKHLSGIFYCDLCCCYYKTELLLKTHQTEKHLYKYHLYFTKCPEVSFNRLTAKRHYVATHLTNGTKKDANRLETGLSWPIVTGGGGVKKQFRETDNAPVKKRGTLPEDFLLYSPIPQLEQYELIKERRNTRNYMESEFKCDMCYRGYREIKTYNNHLKKHDPDVSGPLQCDICKMHFKNTSKMYMHMTKTHLYKYSCQKCKIVCYSRLQATSHYKWHKNVTYPCSYCNKEFSNLSTKRSHIRIKHPSNHICNICGHSFVSETGISYHKQKAHSKEERYESDKLTQDISREGSLYCIDCEMRFVSDEAFVTHLGSSKKHTTVNLSAQSVKICPPKNSKERGRFTEVVNNAITVDTNYGQCGKLPNNIQAQKHYKTEHPGEEVFKRYMCDVCGYTTQTYANLVLHTRTHTKEKPYACPYCDRRFSMPGTRNRHLVVHTGEKRHECEQCHRRFKQKGSLKLHIQTVHLKIPYLPWDKKNRNRRKGSDPVPKSVQTRGEYLNAYIFYHSSADVGQ